LTESRRVYRVTGNSPEEINRMFAMFADRLDELEGYRGQGVFKTVPKSEQSASDSSELIRLGEAQTEASDAASSAATSAVASISAINAVLQVYGLKVIHADGYIGVYAKDDSSVMLHGMGDI